MRVLRTLVLSIALACGALLGSALPAQAATVVGSSLAASDANTSESCGGSGECTQWNTTLPGATLVAPAGVVTAFTVRSAVAIQARIRVLRTTTGVNKTVVVSSPFASIPGTNVAHEVDTRLTVQAGDVLAIGLPTANDPPYATTSNGTQGWAFNHFQTDPADGQTQSTEAWSNERELLYNVTVEADADADGYGDESQDLCPSVSGPGACPVPDPGPPANNTPAPTTPTTPAKDTTPPAIATLSLLHTVFSVDKDVSALADTPRGTAFRFALSEAATVTITIEQRAQGRRVGEQCRKLTAANRKRKACVRYVEMRTLERSATAGQNSVAFGGRIKVGNGSRLLPAGRYRALIEARDAVGNASAQRQASFRVVR